MEEVPIRSATTVRVCSYKLLSSSLCTQSRFPVCVPEDLDAVKRLGGIKDKLQAEIDRDAIICIQEVTDLYYESLYPFFIRQGYDFIVSLYGDKSSGYTGIGVAWRRSEFELEEMSIKVAADIKLWCNANLKMTVLQHIKSWIPYFRSDQSLDENCDLFTARTRKNKIILARFQKKATHEKFVVGTYHMPCKFRQPRVMNIHCSLVAEYICRWAGKDPYVLGGDFNIKPDSSMYQLLHTAKLHSDHPEYPVLHESDGWVVGNFNPMKSAYAEFCQREPAFTTYAFIEGTDTVFQDTLDYIFISKEWKVLDVLQIPDQPPADIPSFPSSDEPSDHILIAATLTLL